MGRPLREEWLGLPWHAVGGPTGPAEVRDCHGQFVARAARHEVACAVVALMNAVYNVMAWGEVA